MNAPITMQARVDAYLFCRRQAGFQLTAEGKQLCQFARFADDAGHQGPLTRELAIRWASASAGQRALTAARRIETLRGFARYDRQFYPQTDIPPAHLFGPAHRRLTPHIYTDGEIEALLTATDQLFSPGGVRRTYCRAIFGLLAATGLRLSEATGLKRADVELSQGRLHIRQAKFGKSRWVPLHPTTTEALQQYAQLRDRDPLSTQTDAFFVGDYGRPVRSAQVAYAFRLLRRRLGWQARGAYPAPRLHDLRHTFICRRLEHWYRQGSDIDRHIHALSTYVGHAKVTDTYWYVTATPALIALAAERFETLASGEPV
jgi:integrase